MSSVSISTKMAGSSCRLIPIWPTKRWTRSCSASRSTTHRPARVATQKHLQLSAPWQIAESSKLPIDYDAVVSAVSQPVTEQDVLSIVFVVEWKE